MINNSFFAQIKASCLYILRSKLSLFVLLLTLFLVIIDAKKRFFGDDINNNKQQTVSALPILPLPKANAELQQEVDREFKSYQENDMQDADKALSLMGVEEQAKQQGELTKLFAGDNIIELKAVIINTKPNRLKSPILNSEPSKLAEDLTVLLLVTNAKSNNSVIERFTNQDDVYGYKLNIIENTQITLIKNNEQGQQKVVLTMYEKNKRKNKE